MTDSAADSTADAAPELTPGNPGHLTPEQLAYRGQWTALAALAHHGDAHGWGLQALRQLIRSANHPVAFIWMWATLLPGQSPQAWGELSNLPRPLRIPESLVEDVAREVAVPVIAATPRTRAMHHLLRALDPDDPGSARIAWAVLDREAPSHDEQAVEAVRLLGASGDPTTRAQVLSAATAAGQADPPQVRRRLELIAALQPPFTPQEQSASAQAAHALIEQAPLEPGQARTHAPWAWPALHALAPRLGANDLITLCSQTWITGSSGPAIAAELFSTALLQALPEGERSRLVEQANALPAPVRIALLERLPLLPAPMGLPLIELAHQVLPDVQLGSLHAALTRQLQTATAAGDTRERALALAGLQLAALTVPRHPSPPANGDPDADLRDSQGLQAWTATLRGAEITGVVRGQLFPAQLRRLGAAGGLLLLRAAFGERGPNAYPLAQAQGDALALVQDLDDKACAAVLSGLVPITREFLPDNVRRQALRTGPRSTTVVAHAGPAPTAAVLRDMLAVGRTAVLIARALDVLEATPADTTIQVVHHLADQLDWSLLEDEELLERAASALARHPQLFRRALSRAVTSLTGPAGAQASNAHITTLVATAIAIPDLVDGEQGIDELAAVLVECARPDLQDTVAHWLSAAAPTKAVVELTARASSDSAKQPNRYTPARQQQAGELCRQASDQEHPADQRLHALQLAAIADPDQAHAAAMSVIHGAPRSLRRGAAQVLVDTPEAAHDSAGLEQLISDEEDRATKHLLETARRHITSDSTEQALVDLMDFLGVDRAALPTARPDTAVCLPEPSWHGAFRDSVNQVRASVRDTPRNRVNNLITLGEAIGEQAILAFWRQEDTSRSRQRIPQLLAHSEKVGIGNLVREPQLLEEMPWLYDLASLRRRRSVHASQRNPDALAVSTSEHVVTALDLTRSLVQGWVQTMYLLRARRDAGTNE